MALKKLKFPGPQAVMVGDTPYDAEAAVGAGTSAAGVLTGGFSREALLEAGCLAVAGDLLGLVSRLERGEQVDTSTS